MQNVQVEETVHDRAGDRGVEVTESHGWFSPGRVIGALAGGVLVAIGATAMLRAGVDGDLVVPQVDVLGLSMSAAVGMGMLGTGLLLLLLFAAWEDAKPVSGVIGILGVLAGLIGMASSDQLRADIGFSQRTAWFVVICGALAILAAVLPSLWHTQRDVRSFSNS